MLTDVETSLLLGERTERCQWQMKRGERVAAVDVQRRHTVAKAHIGYRNRRRWQKSLIFDG